MRNVETGEEPYAGKTPLQLYFEDISELPLMPKERVYDLSRALQEIRASFYRLARRLGKTCRTFVLPRGLGRLRKGTFYYEEIVSFCDRLEEFTSEHPSRHLLRSCEKARSYEEDYLRFRNEIVEANLRLVVFLAKQYRNLGLSFEDLLSEGNSGLLTAAEHFDYHKGTRFGTYALWWIWNAFIRALTDKSRLVRIPNATFDSLRQVLDAEAEDGEEAAEEKIRALARARKESEEEIKAWLCMLTSSPVSIDAPRFPDRDDPYDVPDEESRSAEEELSREELKRLLAKMLERLPRRHRLVIAERYGLDGREERTLKEVGGHLRLSRERIRQIEEEAEDCLRNSIESDLSQELRKFL